MTRNFVFSLFLIVLFVVSTIHADAIGDITDNSIDGKNSLGDVYLDQVNEDCQVKKTQISCMKFRILRYINRLTNTDGQGKSISIWGPIRLVALKTPSTIKDPIFADLEPRTTDSEFEQMFKYASRQLERLVSKHALSWSLGGGDAIGVGDVMSLVDEERPDVQLDGRGKKKKIAILLPLLLFFKLKALLIPILLSVLFIKKLLIIGAFLIPSALSYFKHHDTHHEKVHYEQPHHGYADASPEYSSSYDTWAAAPSKDYVKRSGSAKRRAQDMAYQSYYSQLNQAKNTK